MVKISSFSSILDHSVTSKTSTNQNPEGVAQPKTKVIFVLLVLLSIISVTY